MKSSDSFRDFKTTGDNGNSPLSAKPCLNTLIRLPATFSRREKEKTPIPSGNHHYLSLSFQERVGVRLFDFAGKQCFLAL
jgi:hypothetical protein